MNVVTIEPRGDRAAILVMDDGTRVWTPDRKMADGLIGHPIPTTWTQKQGEYGPQAFPPRESRGGGSKPAWANTEEGAKYAQERMDRRTALMQAVIVGSGITTQLAEKFYTWLRKSVDGDGGTEYGGSIPSTSPEPNVSSKAPPPSSSPTGPGGEDPGKVLPPGPYMEAEDACRCGARWGPNKTASGKRLCINGHVERHDG